MPEKNRIVSLGGSVEGAMKGEYLIDVKSVLNEAWQHTLKSRMSINIALITVMLFGMMVSYITSNFFGGLELVIEGALKQESDALQIINVVVTIAVWPLIAGIEMMGVFHAINKPTQSKMVFSFLNRGSWVALCALFTSVLVGIGFQFLIIPGLVLAVLLSLTIPLVVEKKMSPFQAITVSIKSLRFKLLPLMTIYSVLFIALVLLTFPVLIFLESSIAPVGIIIFLFGMSYLAPWYYNVKGILYREIFGVFVDESSLPEVEESAMNNDTTQPKNDNQGPDDTFSA